MHRDPSSLPKFPSSELADDLQHIFVYGTLKRGECRERCWPKPAHSVRSAWTLGALFDTGPYPAFLPGNDRVAGEIWSYPPADIDRIRTALDIIEVTNQPGEQNLYDRLSITAYLLNGQALCAEVYIYALLEDVPKFARVQPWLTWCGSNYAAWPANATWPIDSKFDAL